MNWQLRDLELQNALLREALSYYADDSIWHKAGVHPKGAPKRFRPAPVNRDKGDRARMALLAAGRSQPRRSLLWLLRRTLSGTGR